MMKTSTLFRAYTRSLFYIIESLDKKLSSGVEIDTEKYHKYNKRVWKFANRIIQQLEARDD